VPRWCHVSATSVPSQCSPSGMSTLVLQKQHSIAPNPAPECSEKRTQVALKWH